MMNYFLLLWLSTFDLVVPVVKDSKSVNALCYFPSSLNDLVNGHRLGFGFLLRLKLPLSLQPLFLHRCIILLEFLIECNNLGTRFRQNHA